MLWRLDLLLEFIRLQRIALDWTRSAVSMLSAACFHQNRSRGQLVFACGQLMQSAMSVNMAQTRDLRDRNA